MRNTDLPVRSSEISAARDGPTIADTMADTMADTIAEPEDSWLTLQREITNSKPIALPRPRSEPLILGPSPSVLLPTHLHRLCRPHDMTSHLSPTTPCKDGQSYHVYCSPQNPGAAELLQECIEKQSHLAQPLVTTTEFGKLQACEPMLPPPDTRDLAVHAYTYTHAYTSERMLPLLTRETWQFNKVHTYTHQVSACCST